MGKLPSRYSFILNPYPDERLSKCPKCDQRTHPRKFALIIVVDGFGPMVLGKTCRFCTPCELLIVHQDELEHELVVALEPRKPEVIDNEYMVFGTVDKKVWRKGVKGDTKGIGEMLDYVADFKEELELKVEPGGWYPSNE